MAHWIIEDKGFDGSFYECSNCGARWCDLYASPGSYDICPRCGAEFCEDEENEYICDLNKTPVNKEAKKEEQIISEYFASFGKTTLDWLKNCIADEGGFMVISRKEYDEMKAEIAELQSKFEEANDGRHKCLDILKRLGITEDNAKTIIPDTGELIDTRINPYTMRKKVILSFEVEG